MAATVEWWFRSGRFSCAGRWTSVRKARPRAGVLLHTKLQRDQSNEYLGKLNLGERALDIAVPMELKNYVTRALRRIPKREQGFLYFLSRFTNDNFTSHHSRYYWSGVLAVRSSSAAL